MSQDKSVTVRYFALFRENAGLEREDVSTTAATVGALFASLKSRHGSSEPLTHCKVAVNDVMVTWDAPLSDGDTVLFFPPVAGG